jgi:hypothetical protein
MQAKFDLIGESLYFSPASQVHLSNGRNFVTERDFAFRNRRDVTLTLYGARYGRSPSHGYSPVGPASDSTCGLVIHRTKNPATWLL